MAANKLEKIEHNGITWTVGDKVVVRTNHNSYIAIISRITDGRGGTIYVKSKNGENNFDLLGNQRGTDIWNGSIIERATQEDTKLMRGKIAISRLKNFNWASLSPELAIEIRDFLKENYISNL